MGGKRGTRRPGMSSSHDRGAIQGGCANRGGNTMKVASVVSQARAGQKELSFNAKTRQEVG
ncbi:hypothetical protein GE21DRAFT_1311048 [Neurospora crassa]|nr:hypothetical protein GE21DRAFT_1311048 [Neurospora crassa]